MSKNKKETKIIEKLNIGDWVWYENECYRVHNPLHGNGTILVINFDGNYSVLHSQYCKKIIGFSLKEHSDISAVRHPSETRVCQVGDQILEFDLTNQDLTWKDCFGCYQFISRKGVEPILISFI